MTWRIEVKVQTGPTDQEWEWKPLHSTSELQYDFDTEDEAIRAMEMCYPDHQHKVRACEN